MNYKIFYDIENTKKPSYQDVFMLLHDGDTWNNIFKLVPLVVQTPEEDKNVKIGLDRIEYIIIEKKISEVKKTRSDVLSIFQSNQR